MTIRILNESDTVVAPNPELPPRPVEPPSYDDAISEAGSHAERELNQEELPSQETHTQIPTRTGKRTFGERVHRLSSRAGKPLNKAANVVGAEGWWPSSMDRECLKAARILYSFTSKTTTNPTRHVLHVSTNKTTDLPKNQGPLRAHGPKHPTGLTRKSLVKIPPQVLATCAGLAIFSVLRGGAWYGSLSGGSGVVIARRPDGTWSPPSSFVVSSLGAGFAFGLDVHDCVCVLNTPQQVAAFMNPRIAVGGGASVAVGPLGGGGAVNAAVSKTKKPMWSYMKSRGLWVGLQIDGTAFVSRADANAAFYQEKGITATKILTGDVAWPMGAKPLFEVLKAIEGRPDVNATVIDEVGSLPPPGDEDAEGILAENKMVATEAGAVPEDQVHGQQLHQQQAPPPFNECAIEDDMPEQRTGTTEDLYSGPTRPTIAEEKQLLAKSGF